MCGELNHTLLLSYLNFSGSYLATFRGKDCLRITLTYKLRNMGKMIFYNRAN